MKFKKNIFQVWYQGCDKLENPTFVQNMQNWKAMNKDWNYYCLSDNDLRRECAKFSDECLKTYDNFDLMHLKIDFGRYVTLYNHGGIYTDVDTYVLRPLSSSKEINEVINKCNDGKHVIGLSKIGCNILEKIVFQCRFFYNNGIIISSQGNPFIKSFIEHIMKISKNNKYKDKYFKIQNITGPVSLTRFTQQYMFSNIALYEFDSSIFDACFSDVCQISNNTICLHVYSGSWIPEYIHMLTNLWSFWTKYKYYIIITFIVIIYVLIQRHCHYCSKARNNK